MYESTRFRESVLSCINFFLPKFRFLPIIFIAFLTYSLFARSTYASQLRLIKDSDNPLNHNFFLLQTTVQKTSSGYEMWYTGSNSGNLKIGYSTSFDGKNWSDQSFPSINDVGDNHDPSLFYKDNETYLYYISEPQEGSGVNIKIKRGVPDNNSISNVEQINLPRQSWNSQKLSCPYGYYENGTYFLFYCGTNGGGWHLGLATSINGVDFVPCSNNPIITDGGAGNAQLYIDDEGIKHLLYHNGNGIVTTQTTGDITCFSQWTNFRTLIPKDKPYDQSQIIAPSLVHNFEPKMLFYTARGPQTAQAWKLNLATEKVQKEKVVIIPGFFASWNKNAILHNMSEANSEWKIPDYIKEYDGLRKTFRNLNLEENDDYYFFKYDWRKSIDSLTDDLNGFLQTNIWDFDQNQPVQLVGHSMGGLIARIYLQKYNDERITKVVTAGTPHKGVVQVYSPLEAGETLRDNSMLWLGSKFLININRQVFKSDREFVRTMIPSLYDLFPTYEFLKDSKGNFTPIESLSIKNYVLSRYSNIDSVQSRMTVIFGNKAANSSPVAYGVTGRGVVDRLVGDYPDGRPIKTTYSEGDYLVPVISGNFGTNTLSLPLDHGEIIYSQQSIKAILDTLSVGYEEAEIAEGNATQISPSILIAIQSPVQAQLEIDGQIFSEENGIIFVPGARSGDYKLSIKKLEPGDYKVTLAQIAEQNDIWEQFSGNIDEYDLSEVDEYTIAYNQERVSEQIALKKCKKIKKKYHHQRQNYPCKLKKYQ